MTVLRVATYNIHKGVQGIGPARRLEIHNLGHAVEQLDADIVCLQEVRKMHRREAAYFTQWPELPQAEFLAPEGYTAVYRTNAHTRHGEHGNAMLSRWPVVSHQQEDMSDHRFEQRGLLHSVVTVHGRAVHVLVVHLGLIKASRVRRLHSTSLLGTTTTGGRRCRRRWQRLAWRHSVRAKQPHFHRECRLCNSITSMPEGSRLWACMSQGDGSGGACRITFR
jgi:endonuclease/exonuclease/phosphatase family metal-dependent hydrolase